MSKRRMTFFVTLLLALALLVPTTALAATPYKDVTKKYVGADAYKAIVFMKANGGYKDIAKGKKLYPYKKVTRREFCTMLGNLYGDEYVPVSMKLDVRQGNYVATEKYACAKMVAVAKKKGVTITWSTGKQKLTRALAAQYLKTFAEFDKAFSPGYKKPAVAKVTKVTTAPQAPAVPQTATK